MVPEGAVDFTCHTQWHEDLQGKKKATIFYVFAMCVTRPPFFAYFQKRSSTRSPAAVRVLTPVQLRNQATSHRNSPSPATSKAAARSHSNSPSPAITKPVATSKAPATKTPSPATSRKQPRPRRYSTDSSSTGSGRNTPTVQAASSPGSAAGTCI